MADIGIDVQDLNFIGANGGSNYQAGTIIDNDPVNADLNNIESDLINHSATLAEIISWGENTDDWITGIDRTIAETITYINTGAPANGLLSVAVVANTTSVTNDDAVFPTSGAVYDMYIAHRDAVYQAVGDVRHAQANIKSTGENYAYTLESLIIPPTSLYDELMNTRIMIDRIIGLSTWADTPPTTIDAINTKLSGIADNANLYVHPTTDGSLHVPVTGTTNNGKVLTAGSTAGSFAWKTIGETSAFKVVTKTASYTATSSDYIILVNATAAAATITLPAAIAGKMFIIKKIDSSANAVTIDGNGSQTIDGELTLPISIQYESYTIVSDGTAWYIV